MEIFCSPSLPSSPAAAAVVVVVVFSLTRFGVDGDPPDGLDDVVDDVEDDADVGRVGDRDGGFSQRRVGRRRVLDLHVQQLDENGNGAQPNEQERVAPGIFGL